MKKEAAPHRPRRDATDRRSGFTRSEYKSEREPAALYGAFPAWLIQVTVTWRCVTAFATGSGSIIEPTSGAFLADSLARRLFGGGMPSEGHRVV
jgi:hypothetical protein